MAARQELHSGLSEMATQTQNYKLHKFELKDAPADITAINASMDIIDTQLKALADGKFDKTGGTISGNLVVNGSTTLKKLTASELDLNGNADVSGTLKVAGATTLTGALAANGGVTTTTLKATGTSTLAAVNATNISASGTLKVTGATTLTGALAANGGLSTTTIKATGTSTLAAVNATNITASGTLNVTGTTTLTGKLTANGGVTTKSLTATSLDLNGNGDVSGSLTVHGDLNAQGSLNVTDITATGTLKVNGATTLTGLLTANGGVTTKKVTATELDLNGNADVSGTLTVHGATTLEAVQAKGNLTVGGLLNVTGAASLNGGGSVKAPAATVNDASLVSASWVWNLIRRYGLSGSSNTAVEASELWPSRDMNDINATGIYTLSGNWTNSPRGADSFVATGLLLHMHRRHNAGPISWQLCVLQTYENIVFYRFNNGGVWSTWFKMAQDGGVVHKTGDEEIAGQKTLQNRLVFKTVNDVLKIVHPTMDGTTIPETSLFSHINFFDKNDNRQAFIQLADRPNGNLELELVLNNGSSDVVKDERIKIGYNKSTKSFYTVAPTPVTGSNDNSIATTAFVMAAAGTMTLKATRTSAGSFTVTGLKVNQLVMVQCELRNDTWDGGDYSRIASDNTTSPSSLQTGASTGGYSLFMVALAETVTFTVTNNGISSATWKVYVL